MGAARKFSKHVKWSASEVRVLESHYAETPRELLIEMLPGRTINQIRDKANGIGVVRLKATPMTPDQVRNSKRLHMANRRAKDPDGVREYQKQRYHQSRDQYKAKMLAYQKRRFFWARATKFTDITARDLASKWKRQLGRCAITGRKLDRSAQIDHILPRAKGGNNSIGNLQWACAEANLAKRDLTEGQFVTLCADVVKWMGKANIRESSGLAETHHQ